MAQDRPTAAELAEAVREFLERDVMNATVGRVQFHARVAINALGMLERELSQRALVDEWERERDAERELAARIRDGSFDSRLDDVRTEVRALVREKLLIANPRYLGDPDE
jgi:Domain of unknown function (DUF6285)